MAPATATSTPLLQLRGLSKTFGTTKALDGVDLTVAPGEVHALLGENGSGKSTLIKVLNGFHAPDPGAELTIGGRSVPLPVPPGRFREHGLAFVHQDLALVPELSVLENLRVAHIAGSRRPWINWGAERRRARTAFGRLGLDVDIDQPVQRLGATERALLAIVRAAEEIRDARERATAEHCLLVLDEPTVFLPEEGTALLFRLVRDLVADGRTSVLFVSHDLDEVLAHTDRVTVLSDGRLRGTADTAAVTVPQLIEMIVGRPVQSPVPTEHAGHTPERPVHAGVTDLHGGVLAGLSFTVGAGEVVGLTGLAGSGYEDVLPALYGARPGASGTLRLPDAALDLATSTPAAALAHGVVFVPADRARDGAAGELTVLENMTLPVLAEFRGRAGLDRRRLLARGRQLTETHDVRPRDPRAVYGSLSGGNAQKALLAKWLQTGPRLVLLHEPTQGVDIGARTHIHDQLASAARGGAAIVVASSDYEQLATLCDRVLVLARGRVVEQLAGPALTRERIADRVLGSVTLHEATGSSPEVTA
ncbi:ATP-binding cassette domain-containing protein [Modestobacter sp. I12A-02628]|uniref:Sugar ABC transporter ATP-binding protein n=1 Tax=Goekera deserti TaxID=2497753 RepID=A0A7K3W9Z7_9ACTN|nr:ATP-binding cassette domain-containing protein [Goekera deserti]NDI47460.1 ATP-binding cassette domain-containing protein [Goekera deserti]NEL53271.1 sugar ABC transporter ATP-binding protein [Goekera deserti]